MNQNTKTNLFIILIAVIAFIALALVALKVNNDYDAIRYDEETLEMDYRLRISNEELIVIQSEKERVQEALDVLNAQESLKQDEICGLQLATASMKLEDTPVENIDEINRLKLSKLEATTGVCANNIAFR